VLRVFPLCGLRADELLGALVERDLGSALGSQGAAGSGSLCNRVSPLLNCLADLARLLPSQSKRHIREPTQADFSALPADDDPQHPASPATRQDLKVQAGDTADSV